MTLRYLLVMSWYLPDMASMTMTCAVRIAHGRCARGSCPQAAHTHGPAAKLVASGKQAKEKHAGLPAAHKRVLHGAHAATGAGLAPTRQAAPQQSTFTGGERPAARVGPAHGPRAHLGHADEAQQAHEADERQDADPEPVPVVLQVRANDDELQGKGGGAMVSWGEACGRAGGAGGWAACWGEAPAARRMLCAARGLRPLPAVACHERAARVRARHAARLTK